MPEDTSNEDLLKIRKFLKERLQRDYSTFRGHENERDNIRELLKRTAEVGESNSMLLIGPRGAGKTTVSKGSHLSPLLFIFRKMRQVDLLCRLANNFNGN